MRGKWHERRNWGTTLKRVWKFLWEDDSIWSWITSIAVAFVIIKFIVYPGLGLALGTTHPIVAVVSGSMEHDGSFEDWWGSPAECEAGRCSQRDWYLEHGILDEEFKGYDFPNGFDTGDIMLLTKGDPAELERGDIVVFYNRQGTPIIHRVIRKWQAVDTWYFQTKGDHNIQSISNRDLNEFQVNGNMIIGRARLRVPLLGYVKIWFVDLLKLAGLYRGE
ncbi:signal peptidase I [Candidatus Woesearchaeota archaeon]|nr:signal peptidase I [Candidatus Woesearchaeota archaeon]